VAPIPPFARRHPDSCHRQPRSDLLRPEMHAYYAAEVEKIRREVGDFILVNTNFNHVNAFGPDMISSSPSRKPVKLPRSAEPPAA